MALVQQVGEHADHVETVRLGRGGELAVPAGRLVGLERDADLGHDGSQVRSDERIDRRTVRVIRMTSRSSGSGQATRLSCSSQSDAGSWRCLAGSSGTVSATLVMRGTIVNGRRAAG